MKAKQVASSLILGTGLALASLFILGTWRPSGAAASHADTRARQMSAALSRLSTTSEVTLLVATSTPFWPMEYISDTQLVGHDIDLMNAVGARMGATVVYTDVAWDGIFEGLVAGEYDAIIAGLTVTPEREEIVDFTLPYVTIPEEGDWAIALQEGDHALRAQINRALKHLHNDGTIEALVAAIAADKPEWQPRVPDWPLLVATSADYPPMEHISGTQIVGHDIDLMNGLVAEMSTTVVYIDVAFSGILTGLVEGGYDAVISTLSVRPEREAIVDFTLPYLNIADEPIAIAVQQNDDSLRRQLNAALRQLRADGTLDAMVAAVTADKPEWQPRLPDWPYLFLPLVLFSSP